MVPVAGLNGVVVDRVDADLKDVESLLDAVADTGLPYFLEARSGCGPPLADLAAERGMVRGGDLPLMALDGADDLPDAWPDGLRVRRLAPDEAQLHADVAAAGFEAPPEIFRQLMTPAVLNLAGMCCYIGEVDGQSVSTGYGLTIGDFVGIFNVATPPSERRRGYGAAITVRAVRDGMADGARWAWLQASPAGVPMYERLGFQTIEAWHQWLVSS
jgi:hypothetical protein